MNQLITMFDKFSWTKDDQIDETLQHNLQLIQQNCGKNPSVTPTPMPAPGDEH
ncbi:hypothetical protein LLF88_04260 [bacterium]|nr:hypothetical protein [bacterium]